MVRFGAEYALTDAWSARVGYSWAQSPVPTETLTPLTAIIPEHTISAGLGWKNASWSVDFGWQWQLPKQQSVERSLLVGGEYAGSSARVGIHIVALSSTYSW